MPLLLNATDASAVEQAARRLAAGSLVGMPTETVYGLAADADNATAVHRIFEAKGRPADHPLIVHLAPGTGAQGWRAGVDHYARDVPAFATALMNAFWPGPLTLILPRRDGVAAVAAGGQDSVGLRCPAHPVAQALLTAAAEGVRFQGEENLGTYQSSDWAERGFCKRCGSNLFYHLLPAKQYMMAVGSFDDPTPFKLIGEIFVDQRPEGQGFAGDLPQYTEAEFMAKFVTPAEGAE